MRVARRVVITGLGVVSPLGIGRARVWRALLAQRSGIVASASHPHPRISALSKSAAVVAAVPWRIDDSEQHTAHKGEEHHLQQTIDTEEGFALERVPRARPLSPALKQMPLGVQYAALAASEALVDAEWTLPSAPAVDWHAGVAMGSGVGALDEVVTLHSDGERCSPWAIPKLLPNITAGYLAATLGLGGPTLAPATACAASAHAIGDAAELIRRGQAHMMLAGGTEAALLPLTAHGFHRARALSSSALRPFHCHRDGFVMGEGAAVLVLEELDHARARGARIYAELRGYGVSGDAHHLTAPREDGRGALLAMQRALNDAQITPGALEYINAHATGTPRGDAAESAAIAELLGSHRPDVPVSSTKGASGHLLGASGAFEALVTVLAIAESTVPSTYGLSPNTLDASLAPLNYVFAPEQRRVRHALSNSFGFGGTNAALVFSALDVE